MTAVPQEALRRHLEGLATPFVEAVVDGPTVRFSANYPQMIDLALDLAVGTPHESAWVCLVEERIAFLSVGTMRVTIGVAFPVDQYRDFLVAAARAGSFVLACEGLIPVTVDIRTNDALTPFLGYLEVM